MKEKKNKVLITGITGMVGSHLADYILKNTAWEIHGMCRWRSPQENIEHLIPFVNQGERIYLNKCICFLKSTISSFLIIMPSSSNRFIFFLVPNAYPPINPLLLITR